MENRATSGGLPSPTYTVAEFFCGCGGLSHGFSRSGRFRVVFGNDVKKEALWTFRHNHSQRQDTPEIVMGDIRRLGLAEISDALARQGVGYGELDVLAGGPPCQGFSQMRRSEKRGGNGIVGFSGYDKLDQDPRNDLVLRFLEIAHALSPKIIMIENVPQMLIHGHNGKLGGMSDNVKSLLREMGYSVLASVVNAADYGVPQLRERVVFVASRIGPASFPEATHRNPEALDLFRRMCPPWRTVRDAIADLPCDPPHRDDWGGGPLGLYGRATPSEYSRLLRSHTAFPYNHVTRAYQQRIIRIIREMGPGETWDAASERMQARYEKLVERNQSGGETSARARKRLIEEGKINPVFFRRYYWSAYTRLDWGRPALTITANANFLGSGRFTHPDRDRGITVREAARLQSFDDDFAFITRAAGRQSTERIGVGMDMIGEAVPPLLGEAFGRHFAGILDLVNGAGQNCGATDPERRAGAYDERRSVQDSR